MSPAQPPDPDAGSRGGRPAPGWRRLVWFVAFYALSLVAFTALVYFLRAIVKG